MSTSTSTSRRSSASRPLSLHPSALSDAEHPLFTASLAELLESDDESNWAQASMHAREARAWIRGRYVALPSRIVDEIFRLFPPTLSAGEFFAVLRLVLHGQSGQSIQQSLVFLQASMDPAVTPNTSTTAFLPTPAPSPDLPTRPPLPPRKPTSPTLTHTDWDASSTSSIPVPTFPLRRTVSSFPTKLPSSPPAAKSTLHRAVSIGERNNPFRPSVPPRPPRRASASVPTSPSDVNEHVSAFSDSNYSVALPTPRTALPTASTFRSGVPQSEFSSTPSLPVHAGVSRFEAAYGQLSNRVDVLESARWEPGGEAWGPL